jgi:hypothetical protein
MLPFVHRCQIVWYSHKFPENGPVPSLSALHILLEQLAFQALTVTGPTVPLYERGDCAAAVYKNWSGQTFSIYLAAQNQHTVDVIAETLCDNMPGHGERRPA